MSYDENPSVRLRAYYKEVVLGVDASDTCMVGGESGKENIVKG